MSDRNNRPFSPEEEEQLLDAIRAAELNTSGEIRLHAEQKCPGNPYDRAVKVFEQLGMTKTAQRNGVLVYIALDDHKFAIAGDKGINEKVPADFWESTKNLMLEHFKKGNLVDGLIEGIEDAGKELKQFFPYQDDDVNELNDDISYGS